MEEVTIPDLLVELVEKICVVVIVAYLVTRSRFFDQIINKQLDYKNRLFIIAVFGAFSIFGTSSGIHLPSGAIANIRDLGPMIAGLIGGPTVGLGAGLIGGTHRYFEGGLTCEPCSLATVIAGLTGGLIYTWRKGELPGVWGATLFATLMESFHMVLVLIMSRPFNEAVEVTRLVSLPMIMANAIGMAIFALIANNVIEEKRTAGERDRLRRDAERRAYEMEVAQTIQKSFLPESAPDVGDFELAALNLPALEVGGDFYDFIPVSNDKWGLVVADVSGKGVPAALFMTVSRTLVRANALGHYTAADVIERANDLISEDDRSSMFVTLFYAVLDIKQNTLRYVNAGHNPPLLLEEDRGEIVLLEAKGIALGVMPGIKLEEREISLEDGAVVVFYTDGVTEAVNSEEEQFGQERLARVMEENRYRGAQEIIDAVRQAIADFVGDQPQFDDITLIVLKSARDGKQV
ncbi:PP2C family protein-serine/threonine phosphatase [Chloroflexota bacterium]